MKLKNVSPDGSFSENTHAAARGGDRHALTQHLLLATDFGLICLSALAAWYFRFGFRKPAASVLISFERLGHHVAFLLLFAILFVLFAHARKLYINPLTRGRGFEVFEVMKSTCSAALIVTSAIYLSGEKMISRDVIVTTVVLSTAALALRRLSSYGRGLWVQHKLLIVGAGRVGQALRQYLFANPRLGYVFVGYIDRRMSGRYSIPSDVNNEAPILGSIEDMDVIIKTYFIDEILVTLPADRNLVKDVAAHAIKAGIDLRVVPDLYDGLANGAPVQFLGTFPMLAIYQQPIPTVQMFVKRLVDVVVSSSTLLVLSPILVMIAAAIKLNSPGPVFYPSSRVGKKGRTFTFHKLRTMVVGAESQQKDLASLNERGGALFKISNDPRVTSLGRILRKYSIDELPQLWNVLTGNMSLVGPRPPLPSEYEQYEIDHLRRLEVSPGITGLWQVKARQSTSFDEYINLDLEYVENWSFWLDVQLLFRTVYVVLAGTGR
jgi:exopolysaccharide biosynthesis polyprenyl glycosylphosphotransferase